jgi:DNA-binding transcriptional MerR regulator
MDKDFLSLGDVARRLGAPAWALRRLFEKSLLPPAVRVGKWRVFRESDVPVIARALAASGLAQYGRPNRVPA